MHRLIRDFRSVIPSFSLRAKGVRHMNGFIRKPLVPGALALALALGSWLPACSAQDKDNKDQVLAVINGKSITEAEVREASKDQFQAMEREYQQNVHQLLENGLEQVIRER